MDDEEFGLGCKMRSKHKIWGVGSNIGGWCKFLDENCKILWPRSVVQNPDLDRVFQMKIKEFNIMMHPFRNDRDDHGRYFNAIVALVQFEIRRGGCTYQVKYSVRSGQYLNRDI